ncbi:Dihydroneopterin aldolase [Prochlorococcus marinus str. MIT 9107]|uniref:7,8-dihydroneopterin aldolase n=2 Tax=Prochlorococcaceae TaxID=2881426 RepID=A0A0A1ZS76_PROMR|nr:Dihydroneopterin aldolase [Prochlorococcus marinus str. MIT 9107]KGF91401.1 Dihydroneopterin aldolase [Prochlorococcus marinus str. MIT 9116]
MIFLKMETFLKIEDIKLWARVGVLDEERQLGQLFSLDIYLWTDFEKCTLNDDLKETVNYSKLVEILKDQSKKIYCFTIEKYSNAILEIIDKEFQLSKIKIILQKCNPPITGFDGKVSIVRILEKK